MYWNIFSKRVLISLRDINGLVWTWVFPIVLATMFYATFSFLDTVGQFRRFPLGVVDDEAYRQDTAFKAALGSVSGEDEMFELNVFKSAENADSALKDGDIEGYILAGNPPKLIVAADGINQTIAKGFLDQYLQVKESVATILENDPEAAAQISALLEPIGYTKEISLAKNPPTNRVNYFYALLAMICMYGGFQGMATVTYLQANLSPLGARRTLSPTSRWRLAFSDLLGGITVHFLCLITVVLYIIFVLGTDFGSKLWLVLFTCLAGSILGVVFGAFVGVTSKLKEQAKIALLITFTMVCCFLSGLMMSGINYIVAEKAPVISLLNPAARITDAFYCLYYYDTYERYFMNIGILLAMTLILFVTTSFFLRRQRYESI